MGGDLLRRNRGHVIGIARHRLQWREGKSFEIEFRQRAIGKAI